jgi:hypothetical protein
MDQVVEDPLAETRKQRTERRLAALEAHIQDLEERLRKVFEFYEARKLFPGGF